MLIYKGDIMDIMGASMILCVLFICIGFFLARISRITLIFIMSVVFRGHNSSDEASRRGRG